MARKFTKISRLEWAVLLLTALFAAGTLLWFHLAQPADGGTVVETAHAAKAIQPPEKPEAPGILEGEVLDLNTASQGDLTRLPGIGEKKAAAIVAWREEHGGFGSVDEITEVKGIGEGILAKIRPYVTVGGPAAEKGGADGTDPGS